MAELAKAIANGGEQWFREAVSLPWGDDGDPMDASPVSGGVGGVEPGGGCADGATVRIAEIELALGEEVVVGSELLFEEGARDGLIAVGSRFNLEPGIDVAGAKRSQGERLREGMEWNGVEVVTLHTEADERGVGWAVHGALG